MHFFNEYILKLQLTIRATDNRIRAALATVRISITRTVDANPVFINTPYRTTIQYNRAINTTVYTVTATDADLRVWHLNVLNYDIQTQCTCKWFSASILKLKLYNILHYYNVTL